MKKVIKKVVILAILRKVGNSTLAVMEDTVIKGTNPRTEEVATMEDQNIQVELKDMVVEIKYSTIMKTKAAIMVMNHMMIIMKIIGVSLSKEDNIMRTTGPKCSSNMKTGHIKEVVVITVNNNNKMVNLEIIIKTIMEMIDFTITINMQIIRIITIETEDRKDNPILSMKKRKDKWIIMMYRMSLSIKS